MNSYGHLLVSIFFVIFASQCSAEKINNKKNINDDKEVKFEINKSDDDWKKVLTLDEFYVIRQKGTERPFTGKYDLHFEDGSYFCKACGNFLFLSENKFNSHCGWPSFDDVADSSSITKIIDYSHGMIRTEVVCSKCGGHLGHVFDDGPTTTGLRYCINSVSIDFKSSEDEQNGQK